MNTIRRDLIMQRWNVIQHELLPDLRNDVGTLTPATNNCFQRAAVVAPQF